MFPVESCSPSDGPRPPPSPGVTEPIVTRPPLCYHDNIPCVLSTASVGHIQFAGCRREILRGLVHARLPGHYQPPQLESTSLDCPRYHSDEVRCSDDEEEGRNGERGVGREEREEWGGGRRGEGRGRGRSRTQVQRDEVIAISIYTCVHVILEIEIEACITT